MIFLVGVWSENPAWVICNAHWDAHCCVEMGTSYCMLVFSRATKDRNINKAKDEERQPSLAYSQVKKTKPGG